MVTPAVGRRYKQHYPYHLSSIHVASTQGSPTLAAAPETTPRSAWIALGVVLAGSYAVTLNTTVIGVALPTMAADLGSGAGLDIDWVVTGFLLGVVTILPATGWMADRWGRSTVYRWGLWAFAACTIGCVLAPSVDSLVAVRFAQGLAGGILIPVGMTIIYEIFPPHRRGLAMGIWGVGIAAAPAAGPPLGGWLITTAGWRWLFVVMLVLAAIAAIAAAVLLPASTERRPRPLDAIGWALASVAVLTGVFVAREAGSLGLFSAPVVLLSSLSIASFLAFVRRSRDRLDALIDLQMFRHRGFLVVLAVTAPLSVTQYARLNFLPVELQVVRDLTAADAGVILAPGAFGVAVAMPIAGWLVDRTGPRLPAVVGLGIVTVTMLALGTLDPGVSEWSIVGILVAQGVGTALAYVPTTVGAMSTVEPDQAAAASAMQNLDRQLTGALGVALLSAGLVSRVGAVTPSDVGPGPAQDAYNVVFLIAAAVAAVGTMLAARLPRGTN